MQKTKIFALPAQLVKNKRDGTNYPPIVVEKGGKKKRCHAVEVLGPVRFVYDRYRPSIICETYAQVKTIVEKAVDNDTED